MTSAILSQPQKCRIDDCSKPVKFKGQSLCQMHYFRFRRTGRFSINVLVPGEKRTIHSAGYVIIRMPDHPLAKKGGSLYEHRKVIYDIYGDNLPPCQICGADSKWHSRKTHIDHIDRNKSNNSKENLRVLCNACNSRRDRKPDYEYKRVTGITIGDQTKTARAWAKEPGVRFCGASILRRYKRGLSGWESVYGEKLTHNGGIKCELKA